MIAARLSSPTLRVSFHISLCLLSASLLDIALASPPTTKIAVQSATNQTRDVLSTLETIPRSENGIDTGSTERNLNTKITASTTLNATFPSELESFVNTGNGSIESSLKAETIANATINTTFPPVFPVLLVPEMALLKVT